MPASFHATEPCNDMDRRTAAFLILPITCATLHSVTLFSSPVACVVWIR